jgi:outer membrane protein OmpA-like peptidoglycan-associated protein
MLKRLSGSPEAFRDCNLARNVTRPLETTVIQGSSRKAWHGVTDRTDDSVRVLRGSVVEVNQQGHYVRPGDLHGFFPVGPNPGRIVAQDAILAPLGSVQLGDRRRLIMKSMRWLIICFAVPLAIQVCAAQPKDAEGCKDSPLIGRFPGSVIYKCEDKADDVHSFPMGQKPEKKLEGEYHFIGYAPPTNVSNAQMYRNLNTALRTAGYTFDYDNGDNSLTAHMGKTWIQIYVGGGVIYVYTLKEIALTQDVVASAADLSTGLTGNGHIVVNGILFDTGKDVVKPESAAALEEVVKMLKQDPKTKVFVVGHTDNVGAQATNIDLAKRRAAAVVQVLITKYGIGGDRLQAYGVGPYAPLASNEAEDGRSLNRRVELVKQ